MGEAPLQGSGMPGMGWSPAGSGKTIKIIQKAWEKPATLGGNGEKMGKKGALGRGNGGKRREMRGKGE